MAQPRSVLVVEDDADVRQLWTLVLGGAGMEVVTASSAAEALRSALARRFDLILLDVNLGADSGWDILARLDDDDDLRKVPVIMLTGSPDPPTGMQLGRATYLAKPVRIDALVSAVKAILAEPKAAES